MLSLNLLPVVKGFLVSSEVTKSSVNFSSFPTLFSNSLTSEMVLSYSYFTFYFYFSFSVLFDATDNFSPNLMPKISFWIVLTFVINNTV